MTEPGILMDLRLVEIDRKRRVEAVLPRGV